MGEYKGTPGELIYECTVQFTQMVEYGIPANAIFSGQTPPPEGARFDAYFEGPITGPKVQINALEDFLFPDADPEAADFEHGIGHSRSSPVSSPSQ